MKRDLATEFYLPTKARCMLTDVACYKYGQFKIGQGQQVSATE